MSYQENGIAWKEGPEGSVQTLDSYHCGYFGCSVRYSPAEGYFTVADTPDLPHFIDEPGANVLRCQRHGTWLYRTIAEDSEQNSAKFESRCGVEGCDYCTNNAEPVTGDLPSDTAIQ